MTTPPEEAVSKIHGLLDSQQYKDALWAVNIAMNTAHENTPEHRSWAHLCGIWALIQDCVKERQ